MGYIEYQLINSKVKAKFKGYRFHPLNYIPLNHFIGKIKYQKIIKELKDLEIWDKLENCMFNGYWIKL